MELVRPVTRIIAFGECMVELSRSAPGAQSWQLGFAGDSYNVAVYLKRLGHDVDYMSALGKDVFSADMRAAWAAEGIGDGLTLTHATRAPGLYAIRVDDAGERSFQYWRGEAAVRDFFNCPGAESALARAAQARLLYLSGITLSLFTPAERDRIGALAAAVRAHGGDVAFDSNYRARGWPDAATARAAMSDFARHVSIALPTLDDDRALFGDSHAEGCARRWLAAGAREVAVKLGREGAFVTDGTDGQLVAGTAVATPRDTTGAGDSFNAAFIAARLAGADLVTAAETGNRLAAVVVQHPGAIIRKLVMPIGLMPVSPGARR